MAELTSWNRRRHRSGIFTIIPARQIAGKISSLFHPERSSSGIPDSSPIPFRLDAPRGPRSLSPSFLLVAISCGFASGLLRRRACRIFPIAGSAYTYTYATMGELVAWNIAWDLISRAFSNMAVQRRFFLTSCPICLTGSESHPNPAGIFSRYLPAGLSTWTAACSMAPLAFRL